MLAGSRPVPSKGTRLLDTVIGFAGRIFFKLFLVIPVYLYYELFAYESDRKNTNSRRRDSHKYSTRKRATKRNAPPQLKPREPNFADVALSSQPTADVQVDGSSRKKNCCTAENNRRKLKKVKRTWSTWPRNSVSDGDSPGAVKSFTGKQPKIRIRTFAPIIMELMNPLCIKSHLWAQGLLNNKDMEYLEENLLKERQCTYFFGNHLESSYIIRKVDQHGAKGVQKFIACLEAEKEHLGHQDLADILRRHASTLCTHCSGVIRSVIMPC